MPLLVERERQADWLDPSRDDPDELRSLLVPAAPGRLTAFPVSTEVNSVRNNGPSLIEPIPALGEPGPGARPRDQPDQSDQGEQGEQDQLF
jgi:hypothetical protein